MIEEKKEQRAFKPSTKCCMQFEWQTLEKKINGRFFFDNNENEF